MKSYQDTYYTYMKYAESSYTNRIEKRRRNKVQCTIVGELNKYLPQLNFVSSFLRVLTMIRIYRIYQLDTLLNVPFITLRREPNCLYYYKISKIYFKCAFTCRNCNCIVHLSPFSPHVREKKRKDERCKKAKKNRSHETTSVFTNRFRAK